MKRAGLLIALALGLALAPPLSAYIGPGAGFAFLSSFLVLFLTFLLALFSFLSWPFRFVWKAIRGQRAYQKSPVERVVVLGLDGLEPTLAEKFMAEGKLPNLARLKKEGTYARLRTTTPAISPVAWSSFMTGSEPSKHNIFDFLSRDPRTYLPDLSSARIGKPKRTLALGKYLIPLSKPEIRGMRKSVTFWKILGDKGIASTVLRVPITFPPEKFKGHMLSGMCAPDLKGSQGTFAFFTEDADKVRKHEGGVAVLVRREGTVIRTALSGPENSMLKKPEDILLPLTVTIDTKAGGAWLAIEGQKKFFLKEKTFSPWTPVAFKAGLGMKVRGICRFRIASLEPKFEMYVTPAQHRPRETGPADLASRSSIPSTCRSSSAASSPSARPTTPGPSTKGRSTSGPSSSSIYANHAEWEAMLANALKKTPRGVVAIVFETTDSIQHMFFRYLDKAHPALKSAPAGDERRGHRGAL